MCSGCSLRFAALTLLATCAFAAELRVCADPNNLPFSNQREQGFDNQIAKLVGRDLERTVSFVWVPERGESFVRKNLLAHRCDLLMGMPSGFDEAAASEPYYRSTYVFVWRRDRNLNIQSLNDPELRRLRIGVHVVSDDGSNLPPAQALANRGMFKNMVAYSIYGDMSKPNPPAALIRAVEAGKVDMAIAWGPFAGYFAKHASTPLQIAPVSPMVDRPFLPFTFALSMGVQPGNKQLLAALNRIVERRGRQIHQILRDYGVPLLDDGWEAARR
jgi:mxaJ protein